MKPKTNNLTALLLVLLHIDSVLIVWCYQHKSLAVLLLFIQLACLIGLLFLNNVVSIHFFVLLLINFVSLLTTMVFHSGLGVIVIYLNLLLALLLFPNISISKSNYLTIHFFTALLLSIFIVCSTSKGNSETIYNSIYGDFINSNTLGLLALVGLFHWFLVIEELRISGIIKTICNIIVFIVFTYYIYISNCRSALLAILIYLLLLFKKKPFTKHSFNKITKIFIIASFFFVLFYLSLVDKYRNFVIFNKNLYSGRQYVWSDALELIKQFPIFGSGTDFSMRTDSISGKVMESTHNTILGIWRTIGIVPMITFIMLFGRSKDFTADTNVARKSQFSFISCLIISFVEDLFMVEVFYILFLSFLLFNVRCEESRRMLSCK